MKIKLIKVLVRKDAMMTTEAEVGKHELPILESIFGKENINVINVKLPEREIENVNDEYQRLAMKYGGNDEGLFVKQIYGDAALNKLEEYLNKKIEDK